MVDVGLWSYFMWDFGAHGNGSFLLCLGLRFCVDARNKRKRKCKGSTIIKITPPMLMFMFHGLCVLCLCLCLLPFNLSPPTLRNIQSVRRLLLTANPRFTPTFPVRKNNLIYLRAPDFRFMFVPPVSRALLSWVAFVRLAFRFSAVGSCSEKPEDTVLPQ